MGLKNNKIFKMKLSGVLVVAFSICIGIGIAVILGLIPLYLTSK